MMKKLLSALVVLGFASGLSGCVVHTRARSCGLGYHWTGLRCARDYQSRRYKYRPTPRKTVFVRDHR